MKTGAFLCSCADSCHLDLDTARDGVRDVDVVASSNLLCEDGLPAMAQVVEEYDLDQLIVTTPDARCQRTFRDLGDELDLHHEAITFLDHRELAGWVHDEPEATDKTARMLNATFAGLQEEAVGRTVTRDAGDTVVVVGDAETAAALADSTDVVLVADGREFADADADLDDVTVERGRVQAVDGRYGEFDVTLASRVTDDCVSCMKCVRDGPDGMVTRYPVDIDPDAPTGDWTDVCPTDAIEMDGVERTISADQVVYPEATDVTRGGQLGFHTGPVDAGTIAAVERLRGGIEKPDPLSLEMDVCAAGESGQVGCTACSDACPHGAVDRPSVDSVEFDKIACQDCGACTSACPTGAVQLREPSNRRIAREVEALLTTESDDGWWPFGSGSAGIETEIVAFLCSERAESALREYGRRAASGSAVVSYAPILPVRVNCTDTVGEAHLLHALAAGADGVTVIGCGDRCLHSGPDPKTALVERVNRATGDLGLGERVAFFAPDPADHGAFVTALDEFADGLTPSPVPSGEHEATGEIGEHAVVGENGEYVAAGEPERPNPAFDNHAWALESVRAIVEHVDPERDVIRGLSDFGIMTVSDACNLTPTCTNLCPADAIHRSSDGNLLFNHERCVNCGLCEEGCPETAITMETGLDLSLLPENREGARIDDDAPTELSRADHPAWMTVYEGEMLACARCGKPFTSVGSAEKVKGEVGDLVDGLAPDADASIFEYCGDCRAKLLFDMGGA